MDLPATSGRHGESGKDAFHRFLLVRLQSGHQFPKESLLLRSEVPAAYIVSVRDTDTASIPTNRFQGVRATKHFNIALDRAPADMELSH